MNFKLADFNGRILPCGGIGLGPIPSSSIALSIYFSVHRLDRVVLKSTL